MGFFNTLSQSWKEYRLNFKAILSVMLLFYAAPFIISLFINGLIVGKLQSAIALGAPANKYFLLLAIVGVTIYLINHIAYVGILASSFSKKPWTFAEALKNGKQFYWKMLGLFVLISIILVLLILPFFIFGAAILINKLVNNPITSSNSFILVLLVFLVLFIFGIYLIVRWLFAPYSLASEKTSIIGALKQSNRLTKSRWWKTFAWLILAGILASIFSLIISIPYFLAAKYFSSVLLAILLKIIADFVLILITLPMVIIFFKNLYLSFKK